MRLWTMAPRGRHFGSQETWLGPIAIASKLSRESGDFPGFSFLICKIRSLHLRKEKIFGKT